MKIKDLLESESKFGEITEKELTDIAKIALEKCSKSLQLRKANNHLWRGVPSDLGSHIIDTSSIQRKSRSNKNYYTLLMDSSPNFKDFPKRSNSLICSSSITTAKFYGTKNWNDDDSSKSVYEVIPFDSAKIAGCSYPDILNCKIQIFGFKRTFLELDSFFRNLSIDDNSIADIEKYAKNFKGSEDDFGYSINEPDVKPKDFMSYLYSCFDPKKLSMFTGHIDTIDFLADAEYWVSGKVLMIPKKDIIEFNKILDNEAK